MLIAYLIPTVILSGIPTVILSGIPTIILSGIPTVILSGIPTLRRLQLSPFPIVPANPHSNLSTEKQNAIKKEALELNAKLSQVRARVTVWVRLRAEQGSGTAQGYDRSYDRSSHYQDQYQYQQYQYQYQYQYQQ